KDGGSRACLRGLAVYAKHNRVAGKIKTLPRPCFRSLDPSAVNCVVGGNGRPSDRRPVEEPVVDDLDRGKRRSDVFPDRFRRIRFLWRGDILAHLESELGFNAPGDKIRRRKLRTGLVRRGG